MSRDAVTQFSTIYSINSMLIRKCGDGGIMGLLLLVFPPGEKFVRDIVCHYLHIETICVFLFFSQRCSVSLLFSVL